MFNLLHRDGDTNIQLVETQPGVYEVTLHEGRQPLVEFIKTTDRNTALDRYHQAIRDENDQYRV